MSETLLPQTVVDLLDEFRQWEETERFSLDGVSFDSFAGDKPGPTIIPERTKCEVTSILRLLREKTKVLRRESRFKDVGTVQHIGNGVATVSGLPQACTDGLVTFPTGVQGLILNLDLDCVEVILLGPGEGIQGGDLVTTTAERLRVPVGPMVIGRVLDPLGEPLDEQGGLRAAGYHVLEREAPGIVERVPVNEPMHTGLKIVDALLPIGCGQRELIIGDRQTGKTSLAVDTILNQRDSNVDCIYVAVGQKKSSILAVIETLREAGAMAYTTVIMSSPDDPPALRYLAPYAGCTMAEYLLNIGRDVLIVYDDLGKHADAYRELSLLLRRPPGREAYPGDIFYLHSRLLERACKLSDEFGGGSLTALPIVGIQRGNISAYIPTNLISITDGQIVLDADQFNRGVKPAVDVGRSVSRVGGAAQTRAMRTVAGDLRLELAQFEEVARFARFGTEVDQATQNQIERGRHMQAVLKQSVHQPLSLDRQIVILFAAIDGLLTDVPIDDILAFERDLLAFIQAEEPHLLAQITRSEEIDDKVQDHLRTTIDAFRKVWFEKAGKEQQPV
jgi:F-type H+/Na+-transporting ATPase subunit alpha